MKLKTFDCKIFYGENEEERRRLEKIFPNSIYNLTKDLYPEYTKILTMQPIKTKDRLCVGWVFLFCLVF